MVRGHLFSLLTVLPAAFWRPYPPWCKPGDEILIARNCHKVVYNACFLNRLQVHYVEAEFDPTTGFYTRVTQAALDEALAAHPEVARW